MPSRINDIKKSKRGRPPVESEAITVRMAADALQKVDDFRREQHDLPGRPEAIRRLVEIGLSSGSKGAKLDPRAVKKASKVMDGMAADLKEKK